MNKTSKLIAGKSTIHTLLTGMNDEQRRQLRLQLLEKRDALAPDSVSRHSKTICERLADVATPEKHIAAYYALGNEVDLALLIDKMHSIGVTVYVPIVQSAFSMMFAPVTKKTPLVKNRYGILEPQIDKNRYVNPNAIDTVLVPLVGFDSACNRLGMGGGYYDRCFEHRRHAICAPELIGVAFEIQRTATVFHQDWDVPLDKVVTETNTYTRAHDS